MIIKSTPVPQTFLNFREELPLPYDGPLIFMDIETMGLSRKRDPIILIGLMIFQTGGACLHQYFSEEPSDEKKMLQAMVESMPAEGPLLTYNGRSFDIPYVNHRLAVHNIAYRIPPGRGIDLMYWAKKSLPAAPRYTLKAVEICMGIHRDDTLSGAECVQQYTAYLKTKAPELALEICQHNYEDILHMAPLLQLYAMLPDKSPLRTLPFYLSLAQRYWIDSVTYQNGFITLRGSSEQEASQDAVNYTGSASLEVVKRNLGASLPVMEFMYPSPGSLFIDSDRIPGFKPLPFNALPLEEKMALMVRSGSQYLPDSLAAHIAQLLALNA